MMSNELRARAWIEVDITALRENYRTVAARAGDRARVIPMLKADGYGLGAERVARALEPFDPLAFGVAAAAEGVALRAAGVSRPIIVFTPLSSDALEVAAAHRLVPSISSLPQLERWIALGAGPFHVEIDTGMGRAGFDWRETAQWAPRVRELAGGNVVWQGVYTHFHGADAPDATATAAQWQRFQDALGQLPLSREDLVVHACNSAAALRWPEYALDAVRPGIFLYGGRAAPELADAIAPQPVASIRGRVVLVRDVPPGSSVGYGATHVSKSWERWATVSIGYGDGLRRELGNQGSALVRGRRVGIVGRISMDMTVVDVSGLAQVEAGDVATFIGAEGEEEILVDEVAAQAGAISYEVLTGLTPRLPRLELE
ncbi:MAG: alanine racemase [Gemmatimonadota bacterium]